MEQSNIRKEPLKIEPDQEKIANAEKQYKEIFEKYSPEERQEAFDRLDSCLSEYKDVDFKKAKMDRILRKMEGSE